MPSFHAWFNKRLLAKFEGCLIMSVRKELGSSGDIAFSRRTLTKWVQENFLDEAHKAIIRQGKYCLFAGYQMFFYRPSCLDNFEAFLNYKPKSFSRYVKLISAGAKQKPGENEEPRFQSLVFSSLVLVTQLLQRV